MFVDFNKVFAKTPQTEMAIPDALANQLSTKLPCGLKYEVDETGHYVVIVPDNDTKETIKFSGMQFIPTDEQKQVLGENYNFDDLLELSYNSQTPIPFELVNDGVVNINGTDISIDKLYYNPYFPKKIEVNSMVMFPAPLDEKFSITIGSETLSTEILVTRIPNFSIKTKEYETIQEKCLYVRYTWDSNTNKFLFTIKVRIDKAESVNEILKSMIIYNAFNIGILGPIIGSFAPGGGLQYIIYLIPHGIFEITATVRQSVAGILLFMFIYKFIRAIIGKETQGLSESFEKAKKPLIQSLVIMIFAAILLLIAAPIEAYLSVPISELFFGV